MIVINNTNHKRDSINFDKKILEMIAIYYTLQKRFIKMIFDKN